MLEYSTGGVWAAALTLLDFVISIKNLLLIFVCIAVHVQVAKMEGEEMCFKDTATCMSQLNAISTVLAFSLWPCIYSACVLFMALYLQYMCSLYGHVSTVHVFSLWPCIYCACVLFMAMYLQCMCSLYGHVSTVHVFSLWPCIYSACVLFMALYALATLQCM